MTTCSSDRPALTEIEVTPEMVEAGACALRSYESETLGGRSLAMLGQTALMVYEAMLSASFDHA